MSEPEGSTSGARAHVRYLDGDGSWIDQDVQIPWSSPIQSAPASGEIALSVDGVRPDGVRLQCWVTTDQQAFGWQSGSASFTPDPAEACGVEKQTLESMAPMEPGSEPGSEPGTSIDLSPDGPIPVGPMKVMLTGDVHQRLKPMWATYGEPGVVAISQDGLRLGFGGGQANMQLRVMPASVGTFTTTDAAYGSDEDGVSLSLGATGLQHPVVLEPGPGDCTITISDLSDDAVSGSFSCRPTRPAYHVPGAHSVGARGSFDVVMQGYK